MKTHPTNADVHKRSKACRQRRCETLPRHPYGLCVRLNANAFLTTPRSAPPARL